jgi:hypothetical protein
MARPAPATVRLLAALAAAAACGGCITAFFSTSGGRREARRECLQSARGASWTVIDISEAEFLGSARYEVVLTVEREGVPRQPLRCTYDTRDRVVQLGPAETR